MEQRNQISPNRYAVRRRLLAPGVLLVAAAIGTPLAQAQSYSVLYSFNYLCCGAFPFAGVISDPAGNLYGTAYEGGGYNGGIIYKVDTTGAETTLYSFNGPAGALPRASLIRDSAGNLYGTTRNGGSSNFGVVFKLDTSGTETVLHNFAGGADGADPNAALIQDSAGNFYGTTTHGGMSKSGVVFRLDTAGNESVLYSFTGGADGSLPQVGVILDTAGNLYGTTLKGGASGFGVVFKLDTAGNETVLHSFAGRPGDGKSPLAGVIMDATGNLYGTTEKGGAAGHGVVFKLDTAGTETVLHSFAGPPTDGAAPLAGLVQDSAGNLYGTTYHGGPSGNMGAGVVFKLDTTGKETVLYSFTGGADGANPQAGVTLDPAGDLYGTTTYGGASNAGVVFELKP